MQMRVLSTVFAAIVVAMSVSTLPMANAAYSSLSSSPVQPNSKQDAMNTTITAGLQLANQSSQQWQQKHNQFNDQQAEPLMENSLTNHNNKFDNHSPSLLAQLPF